MSDTAAGEASAPQVRRVQPLDGEPRVELAGSWSLRALRPHLTDLVPQLQQLALDSTLHWDLRGIDALDDTGAVLLWRVWGKRRAERLSLKVEHESMFGYLSGVQEAAAERRRRGPRNPLPTIGRKTLRLIDHVAGVLVLIGQLLVDIGYVARHPLRMPWREISASIYRTGAQALGITALVGFLVGIVLSYLSAQQLKLFGADIFIINILGISVIRELGPVLAAILVAGRSGSSMTAQLGVMRVTQELDAMSVMGIRHGTRLIFPKVVALAVSMPLLVLWTSAIALLGGMMSAQIELGIDVRYFALSLPNAVPVANLWLGVSKGMVFGMLIALIACHFGLRIRPNTESLGQGTTDSVVSAITVVILVDALFAVMFSDVGIQ
ncbi:MAG TPA: ABC transporter permease [Burkholderiales bacterium]|nr:ABC transporter permease [Burkholderiales bacterium]